MSALNRLNLRYRVDTEPLRTERRAELLALFLGIVLLLQIAWGASQLWLLSPPEPIQPSQDSLQVREALGIAALSEEQSRSMLQRPLFWPDRRPAGDSAVESSSDRAAEQEDIEGLRLVGVYGAGNSAGIIVLLNDSKLRVGVGETVAGWRVKSVEPGAAVLTSKKGKQRLLLQPASANANPPAGRRSKRGR